MISVSVKAKTKAEQEKFGAALGKMVRADPSLHLETDRETGQTILRGMGELHLEVTLDRMRTEFGVEGIMGEPQVAYRETITKKLDRTVHPQEADRRLRASSPKCGSFSSRCERSAGFEFVDETVGGSVPREYVPSVEKGLRIQKEDGVLAHYPTVDFRATLIDGSYHDVDSNALTFEIAAKACFREGIRKAAPILLEPVMKVETVTPGDYLGDVIGDLNRRRGIDPRPAGARHQHRRGRQRAAVGDVRLHRPSAQHDQRPRLLHDGVLALRSRAAQRRGRGDRQGEQARQLIGPTAAFRYRRYRKAQTGGCHDRDE